MPAITKILLPVDFSELSVRAAHSALRLAGRFSAGITVLHVLPPHFEFGSVEFGSAILEDLVAERQERARQRMEEFIAEQLPGNPCHAILEGNPAEEIARYTHAGGFDLIVMPTHGWGAFRRLLLGSVTAKVLHDAECPVWTGVHIEAPPPPSDGFRRLLCAIDFGPRSRDVLEWTRWFAGFWSAEITAIHAVPDLAPHTEGYYVSPEWRDYTMDAARSIMDKVMQGYDAGIRRLVVPGDAPSGVAAEAAKWKADLVIIGRSSTAGALGRLHSTAYALIRESPCPVVSV